MSEPFIGEIIMFGGNFAPRGWALCDGQLLAISSNQALFSILGTIYGGDGETTFALPEMRGRAPMHEGPGPGLSNHALGSSFGTATEILTENQLPNHGHTLMSHDVVANTDKDLPDPAHSLGAIPAETIFFPKIYADPTANPGNVVTMPSGFANTGGSVAHNNRQPYLGLNFIIALVGIFPSRN